MDIPAKKLLDLKREYIHKRNKHKIGSNHYWRYSGKIEVINDLLKDYAVAE